MSKKKWARKLNINASRRETIYKFLMKKYETIVPCFVCGRHVKENNATLEHIVPLSKGGMDEMGNLTISHYQCNMARGNNENFTWESEDLADSD